MAEDCEEVFLILAEILIIVQAHRRQYLKE